MTEEVDKGNNGKRVLVTRTQPGADETAQRLQGLGFTPILAPALQVGPLDGHIDLVQAIETNSQIIFTSLNGVRLASPYLPRSNPVWCVGNRTSEQAKRSGFQDIRSADGNAETLVSLILEQADRSAPLLHLGHEHPRGRIVERLTEAGLKAQHIGIYKTQPEPDFPKALTNFLRTANPEDLILVHSPEAGKQLSKTFLQHSLEFPGIVAAISQAAAQELQLIRGLNIKIAPNPNEQELLDCLVI